MANDKQSELGHEDQTKDLQFEGDKYVNMEGENRSTASEGTLKEPDAKNTADTFKGHEEDSTDNAVGKAKKEAREDLTKTTTLAEDEAIDKDEVSS